MPTRHRARVPVLTPRPHHPRRTPPRADPLFGYGYNPSWPSILSVAHDEANGGVLFVIMDRPCALVGPGNVVPLSVAGLSVLAGTLVSPIKLRVTLSGAVPHGAAWTWGTGASNLIDPITGHAPNPSGGDCADTPGPYAPPAALVLVAASFEWTGAGGGPWVRLTFDRDVNIAAIHVAAITVSDDPSDETWVGSGAATLVGPRVVQVPLVVLYGSIGPGTKLTATNATGIAAADDGGTWAGVANVALPFG